jgi:hypothetical protein
MKKLNLLVIGLVFVGVIATAEAGKIGPKQTPDMGPPVTQSATIDGKIGPKQHPDSLFQFFLHLLGIG